MKDKSKTEEPLRRVEIFANRSVEEDIMDGLGKAQVAAHYTKVPIAYGAGNSGPRQGTHVWPEENFIMIIYCPPDEAETIQEVIAEVKTRFTQEGIKIFVSG